MSITLDLEMVILPDKLMHLRPIAGSGETLCGQLRSGIAIPGDPNWVGSLCPRCHASWTGPTMAELDGAVR